MQIYLDGGIGDTICVQSYFPEPPKTIHWAARGTSQLIPLFNIIYPHCEHINMLTDIDDKYMYKRSHPKLPACPDGVESWNIVTSLLFCRYYYPFNGSSLLKTKLTTCPNLPSRFVLCQHDTPYNRKKRTLSQKDWNWLIGSTQIPIVVVGSSDSEPLPKHPRVLDYTGLSLEETIEVSKKCESYAGIDSFVSILAAQRLDAHNLNIKASPGWIDQSKDVYYKPHQTFDFIRENLWDPKPLYKNMSNYVKVRCLQDCWLNAEYKKGTFVDLHPSVARSWIENGLAEDWTGKEIDKKELQKELEKEYVEAIKTKRKRK